MDVARIKLNEAALLRDCLVPMPKPPLENGDRFDNISAIRKTFLGLLEFRQAPRCSRAARDRGNCQEQGELPAGSDRARVRDRGNP